MCRILVQHNLTVPRELYCFRLQWSRERGPFCTEVQSVLFFFPACMIHGYDYQVIFSVNKYTLAYIVVNVILSFSNASFEDTHTGEVTAENSAHLEKSWSERAWTQLASFASILQLSHATKHSWHCILAKASFSGDNSNQTGRLFQILSNI